MTILTHFNSFINFPGPPPVIPPPPGTLPYPITQQYFNPASNTTSVAFQQDVSQLNIIQLTAYGGINTTQSFKTQMQNIKGYAASLYSGHTVITGLYQIENGWFANNTVTGTEDPLKVNTYNSKQGWRLQNTPGTYPSGSFNIADGNNVNPGFLVNNDTSGCPSYNFSAVGGIPSASDVHGGPVNLSQWAAWYEINCWFLGNANAIGAGFSEEANPYLDYINRDNQFLYPRYKGYWNSDSTFYDVPIFGSGGNAAQGVFVRGLMSKGSKQASDMYAAMAPTLGFWGNSDAPSDYGSGVAPPTFDAEKLGLYTGTNNEAPIGQSYSVGTHLTFAQVLLSCMVNEVCTKNNDPSKCIWNMEARGETAFVYWDQQSSFVAADWKSARYQIGCTMLLRQISGAAATSGHVWMFDEWNAGVGTPGWLGTPVGSRPINTSTGAYIPPNSIATTAYNTYGIITVIFSGGIVYLYPAGANDSTSGLSAVTLPSSALQNGGGKHITYTKTPGGSQPSGVSSGTSFTSLTIQPRDAIFTLNGAAAPGGFNPPYPRIAACRFSPAFNPNPNYQNWIQYAAIECLVDPIQIAGSGPSSLYYGTGGSNAYVNSRHASTQVPGGCKILNYVNPMVYQGSNVAPYSVSSPPLSPGYAVVNYLGVRFTHIDNYNWMLRSNAPTGNPTVEGGSTIDPNISTYTATDSNGQHYGGFLARWMYQNLKLGSGQFYGISGWANGTDNATNLDGFYIDEVWYTLRFGGDAALQGSTPSGIQHVATNSGSGIDIIADKWRAGYAELYSQLNSDFPAGIKMGNVDYVGQLLQFNRPGLTNPSITGSMYQVMDVAEQQYFLGWGFLEGLTNFSTMMQAYQFAHDYLNPNGVQMPVIDICYLEGQGGNPFGQAGYSPFGKTGNGIPGSAPLTWEGTVGYPTSYTAAYVGMRYYTAFILMKNGAIMTDGWAATTDSGIFHFDEWGNNGTVPCGFLGYPTKDATGAIQTGADAAIGSGIWRRTFQNASNIYHVFMNPRGNGAKSNIILRNRSGTAITMYRLSGLSSTQGATGNDGSAHTTYSFNDPDGVIFIEPLSTTTTVQLPSYTDLYGNTFVNGVSGITNGQSGIGSAPSTSFYMHSENKNPAQVNGFYIPNTWAAGTYTGFTPTNAGGHAQLSVAGTGTSPTSTMQWEGQTVGAIMFGSDLSTSTNRPQFTPQYDFTKTLGSGPVLFSNSSKVLNSTMTIKCPTYVGSGSPQNSTNSPYIHVNLGLISADLSFELDINICILDGAGSSSDIYKSYVNQSPVPAYLFLVPVNAASANPYVTFNSGNWHNGTFAQETIAWSISYAQFQNILNYMAAQGWGGNPAFPGGLIPEQFSLYQTHVNAEMANINTISLGWSMSNWTITY